MPTVCITILAVTAALTACAAAGPEVKTSPRKASADVDGPLSSGDPKVDAILDRLEVKGRTIKGFKCDLTYRYVTVFPVESAQVKNGTLLFARAEPNPRFLIHFDTLIADGVRKETGEFFAFDGRWFIERNDNPHARTIRKTEIVREGERFDPFRMDGKGRAPFPVPIGQKRSDIVRGFKVALKPFELGDPPGSDHLHCVPRPKTELAAKYARVELFIDRKLELPVRIVTERVRDGNRIEVDFSNLDLNEAPAGSRFQIDEPKDYQVTIERLPPRPEEPKAISRGTQ